MSQNPKDLLGNKKPPMWLNPRVALVWMAKAFEFGAYGLDAFGERVREIGYGPYNWREKDVLATVYIAAMERHLAEYLDGDDAAADSKVLHLGHIMACAAILIDAKENGNLIDDRPKRGPVARLIASLTRKDKPKNAQEPGPVTPSVPFGPEVRCPDCGTFNRHTTHPDSRCGPGKCAVPPELR